MKILMVLTSHDRLGDSDHPTGFWLEEFAAPYYRFKDAGAAITLASPKGGQPPADPAYPLDPLCAHTARRRGGGGDQPRRLSRPRLRLPVD